VLLGLWISILLCHAKIDDMDDIGCLRTWSTDKEIVWLDVAVYKVFFVYRLDSGQLGQREHSKTLQLRTPNNDTPFASPP